MGGGEECLRTARLALKRYLRALCPTLGAAALGAMAVRGRQTLRSVPARRALSGHTISERLALARASSVTAFLVYNCFK